MKRSDLPTAAPGVYLCDQADEILGGPFTDAGVANAEAARMIATVPLVARLRGYSISIAQVLDLPDLGGAFDEIAARRAPALVAAPADMIAPRGARVCGAPSTVGDDPRACVLEPHDVGIAHHLGLVE